MMTRETIDRAIDYVIDVWRKFNRTGTVVAVSTLTNGYEVTDRRSTEFHGHAVETTNAMDEPTLVIWHDGEVRDAHKSLYLVDDGHAVIPHYVAGYSPNDHPTALFLARLPLNFNSDGTARLRADDNRPVDFTRWMLNPARAYHVKLSRNIPALRQCLCADNCGLCRPPLGRNQPCTHVPCIYCRAQDAGYQEAKGVSHEG